ncbi:TonB-dependent receptor [Sphingomonas xinjiangensis]|uniref:Iron complex outermembrane receptor protein n=1 Tax=Sphingomonas xinjiangensis TaxID=643568 RepID=A0A840YCS2_9SPHN|nr:TonB-dependent siderophore receptor [Sphingomonas xinjiangensis]MBB5709809.1 iron complex outermembrane receptor protein [Sphingomonas xinjiangensis]
MFKSSTVALLAAVVTTPCRAQSTAAPDAPGPIVVTGQRDSLHLDTATDAGSRLRLTARETPASIEVLSQEELQLRGLRTARETFNDVAGAIAGNVPGNPAVVSLRGFSGNTVSILQDGVRVSASTVVQRDTNSWHYDRVEVLKGPASVMFGEGALAGVINKVTRKPVLGERHLDGLVSVGSFDTVFAAGGINLPVSSTLAVRADASYQRSDSLYDVDNNQSFSAGLTGSVIFRPSDALSLLIAVDHFEDRYDATYQGLPLIPGQYARDPSDAVTGAAGLVADKALRRRNYNPQGGFSNADETTLRSRLDWRLGGGWTFALDLTGYTADRAFVLTDSQSFAAPNAAFLNGSFRQSFQDFRHDHQFWNARGVVGNDSHVGGLRNRFSLGVEYNYTDFKTLRQQTTAAALPPIDAFDPRPFPVPAGPGIFGALDVMFNSRLNQTSVFAEDGVNLTDTWLLVGGMRWDHIELDRETVTNATGVADRNRPTYDPVSWRIGTTYDVAPGVALYAQYTTAVSPVSSILLASIANTRFELTSGRAYEVGFKVSDTSGRLSVTGAAYRIEQKDILTRDPANPTLAVQGGRQSSQGVELTAAIVPVKALRLSGGVSYTDANYDELGEGVAGVRVDRAGNRPINVPSTTLNASALYTLDGDVTLGGFLRHASAFYTDTANTIEVAGHTVLDASIAWRFTPQASLTLRGRNLTDAFYGEYSGYPSTNVYIGAPRSAEIALSTHF